MSTIPKEEFKNKVMEILKDNIHFAPQVDGFVVHGAIDKIWELHQLATDGLEELEKENARLNELVRTNAKAFNESVTTLNGIFESKITALQSSLKEKEKECEKIKMQRESYKSQAEHFYDDLKELKAENEGNKEIARARGEAITELQAENERLQKIVDIVNDRPDL